MDTQQIGASDQALEHLVEQVRDAAAHPRALRIRGGGSKDFYGALLQGELLDTRAWRGIVDYEPSELVVRARCGTPLAELEQALSAQGQYLAFEPPHFGPEATVGGMVAAGLSGPARARSGAVRDFVLGVHMVNGKGEQLRFGGQVMKNVAGYDVSRLMAGSLGILGLITEVSLKVLPQPVAHASLEFEFDQARALAQLNRWAAQPLPVDASCWSGEPHAAGPGLLRLRLRGAAAAVDAACGLMGGTRLPDAEARFFWSGLREQTLPFFRSEAGMCLWRLSLPDSTGVLQLDGLPGAALVEWGGALRWLQAPAEAGEALRTALAAVGGSAAVFRAAPGPGPRPAQVFHPLAQVQQRIHQQLKQQFDPYAIFNRGRMYADL